MKKLNLKVILIVLVIFLVIILIIRSMLMQKKQDEKIFSSIDEIETIQDVMTYLNSEYKKQLESKEENLDWDIYVDLSKDLYTEEQSNEEFYNDLVGLTARVLDYSSFRIIDEEKENLIVVLCDTPNDEIIKVYINGESNYFGKQDSKNSAKTFETEKEIDLEIQSPELAQIINSNWISNLIDFGNKDYTELKYEVYEEKGIKVRKVARHIFNIIFDQNYNGTVINNITPGTDFEDIQNILGQPTLYDEESGIFGYKNQYIYVFFTTTEISVYRVDEDDYNKDKFAELVAEFTETRDAKTFVNSVKDIWDDYDTFEYDSNYIDLRYALRGIKIQFNITSNHGVTLFNNYIGQVTKQYAIDELRNLEEPLKYIYFENSNSVLEHEVERYNEELEYLEEMYIEEEPLD